MGDMAEFKTGDVIRCKDNRLPLALDAIEVGQHYVVSWAERGAVWQVVQLAERRKTHLYASWRFELVHRPMI